MVSQRVLRLWVAVAAVLAVTAGLGYWLSRPDVSAWSRAGDGGSDGIVNQSAGGDGCPDVVLLDIDPAAALGASGQFIRDAEGLLTQAELEAHFRRASGSIRRFGPDATLPESAVETQWTRGDGAALWLVPDSGEYAFIVGDRIEAWPKAQPRLPCGSDSLP